MLLSIRHALWGTLVGLGVGLFGHISADIGPNSSLFSEGTKKDSAFKISVVLTLSWFDDIRSGGFGGRRRHGSIVGRTGVPIIRFRI